MSTTTSILFGCFLVFFFSFVGAYVDGVIAFPFMKIKTIKTRDKFYQARKENSYEDSYRAGIERKIIQNDLHPEYSAIVLLYETGKITDYMMESAIDARLFGVEDPFAEETDKLMYPKVPNNQHFKTYTGTDGITYKDWFDGENEHLHMMELKSRSPSYTMLQPYELVISKFRDSGHYPPLPSSATSGKMYSDDIQRIYDYHKFNINNTSKHSMNQGVDITNSAISTYKDMIRLQKKLSK